MVSQHLQKGGIIIITTILALFILGFGVGTFGTLVGIGGGIILIPIFVLIMNYTPQHAVGTSLTIVLMNAISGTYAYIKQKKIFYDAGIKFAIATIPGAFLGSYLAEYFTGSSFRLTFGIFLMCISALMFFRSSPKGTSPEFDKETFTYNRTLGITVSAGVGFLSSILGIGGGIIHVPIMIYALGFPTHIATATSQFVLAVSSLSGVASHLIIGNVLLMPAITIGLGAIAGAQFGAALSLKTKSKSIIVLLSLALFALGLRLALTAGTN
ncbi:sulfite exporter TauE/SafE family protein [Dendrosporobacter sp. 1207_IL3150]|uniref:sulfite exporter TauE/SafE family protein n=1 Tax=Dendrosporobacter sp. 1207_IL3150 TaxID=3084054 RepID=UPI003FA60637